MAENISKIQLNGTVYTIGNETTTAVTSASTDNEIPTAKAVYDAIPQGGGGKAVSGGTNISITTGETADTINCTLPYNKLDDKENYSIFGSTEPSFKNQATYAYGSLFIGNFNEVKGNTSFYSYYNNYVIGNSNKINGKISNYSTGYNIVIGRGNSLSGTNLSDSYVIGQGNSGYTSNTLLTGWYNQAYNGYESAFGKYNASNTGSTDADKSLFSVGNGTYSARHNAFEIRQNGDIYITKDGQDVKLQDQLGGGSGLKKWEGTRAEYNALSSYDSDTLYIITDEDVEIPVVPTKVSAFENDAGYALKSNSEEITFTLEDGSTVTKKFVLG